MALADGPPGEAEAQKTSIAGQDERDAKGRSGFGVVPRSGYETQPRVAAVRGYPGGSGPNDDKPNGVVSPNSRSGEESIDHRRFTGLFDLRKKRNPDRGCAD